MAIQLTRTEIDAALPRVEPGLKQYVWLQAQRDIRDLSTDREYRKRFNHFYRVRRGPDWQQEFFDLLETKKGTLVKFADVLDTLRRSTGRFEASFSSKLVATIDPDAPLIDSVVLKKLNIRLPDRTSKQRFARIVELHSMLAIWYMREFLATRSGSYLVNRFSYEYPNTGTTEVKMLDFVLWQTRL